MNENIKIEPTKKKAFVDDFFDEYISRGFASMSKREIDVLIMHLLMEHADLNSISNFDLSMRLKLTETKIKNLKYEANLKYSKRSEDSIKKEFLLLLSKAKLQVIGKETWISIVVEDTFLRNAIKAKVKEYGSFTDSSFNSEIVKISAEDFSNLMYIFSDEKERKDIKKEILDLFPDKESTEFKELFRKFFEKVVEGAGSEVGRQGVMMLSFPAIGSISSVVEVYEVLKSFLK